MTRVEFIVLVVLIGVLASLVLPTNVGRKKRSKHVQAQKDMADLRSAIDIFRHDYNYLPVSAHTAGLTNADFTFGTFGTRTNTDITSGTAHEANNSEVMRILTASTAPPGTPAERDPLSRNPRATAYFNPKRPADTHSPGLGTDFVLRDPWGNPYILTLDLDGDGKCKDSLYRRALVSRGKPPTHLFGLTNSTHAEGLSDDFATTGSVMSWSFGPDGKASQTERADLGVNLDNVRSW
jgi:type II secretory pathway pseudopilin PulG